MRAGVFQCAGGGLSPGDRLDRLASALQSEQLDLVVCPELFMSGYDVGDSLMQLAESCEGPFALQVAKLARSCSTAIDYGYPERDREYIYNSAACVDCDGKVIVSCINAPDGKTLLAPEQKSSLYFPI